MTEESLSSRPQWTHLRVCFYMTFGNILLNQKTSFTYVVFPAKISADICKQRRWKPYRFSASFVHYALYDFYV